MIRTFKVKSDSEIHCESVIHCGKNAHFRLIYISVAILNMYMLYLNSYVTLIEIFEEIMQ